MYALQTLITHRLEHFGYTRMLQGWSESIIEVLQHNTTSALCLDYTLYIVHTQQHN